jgi:NSS family neurotransmitter:Na+ symporter
MAETTSIHGMWTTRLAFILAATGSAVGLGNVWKFPYITGENGGGAFVLVYILCVLMIGIPIMMAEILIGRRGRQSPINTMRTLAHEESRHGFWQLIGWSGVIAGFLILSYYSVIAGWAIAYAFRALDGAFTSLSAETAKDLFDSLVGDPERLLAWHTIFMVMTTIVISRGVRSGLEQAVRVLMPALFVLLLILVGFALTSGKFSEGIAFLFVPHFGALTGGAVITAMGHAFFTLSLGMGAIMTYGSYLPANASISRSSLIIALLDTLVALLAGMAIFPIVFASGLEAGAGPGLVFLTLPIAFGNMPGGLLFGTLFFVLLVFAAWTSAISLVEPAVAWLVENRELERVRASAYVGIVAWLLGMLTIMSFNDWAFSFDFAGEEKINGIFDLLDILTANFMLPLGGLAMAVFAGWFMARESTRDELAMGEGGAFRLWWYLIRYVSPLAVALVFLNAVGLI